LDNEHRTRFDIVSNAVLESMTTLSLAEGKAPGVGLGIDRPPGLARSEGVLVTSG
jgi:hypothetical protein